MVMTAEHHAGAMDAPLLLDMGMEALTPRIVVNGYHGTLLNQFGLADANAVEMMVRGGLEEYGGDVTTIEWTFTGNVIDMPFGRIRGRGEVAKSIVQVACSKYEIKIGGEEHIFIDILGMIRRVGGNDRLEALRTAIGA